MSTPADEQLDREFAYTDWDSSCRDLYSLDRCCRRPAGHDGAHASGFGAARKVWKDDTPSR